MKIELNPHASLTIIIIAIVIGLTLTSIFG